MSYNWFSPYSGREPWTPEKGYSELFVGEVRHIREWFKLKKTNRPGIEVSTGEWRKYFLQRETVFVAVDRFEWLGYREVRGYYITPVFRLKVRIAWDKTGLLRSVLGKSKTTREVFFDQTLVIEFLEDYPSRPPRIRIDNSRYDRNSASEAHHMFEGGWLCILARRDDWRSSRDTIISGLNAALDWCVLHYKEFGW